MKIVGIIPARYASSRFPGKPLADINGKSMIQRVYEQAIQAQKLSKVIIATDDQRIYDHARAFDGHVVMTSEKHRNGTERCLEALQKTDPDADFVINIQGDEPFIQPKQIDTLATILNDNVQIGTLIKEINNEEDLFNPSTPKVVISERQNALFFSRQTIPHLRDIPKENWLESHTFFKHIGMYAYRTDVLSEITKLAPSTLEEAEKLEQLRWLENGYKVRIAITDIETKGIDTPEDLEKILN